MTAPWLLRRARQAAIALVLAGTVILVAEWAYPAGQLAIRVGPPHYSRVVAETAPYVSIDLAITNVGVRSVPVDADRFLLEDTAGRRYRHDSSSHFAGTHEALTIPIARTLHATSVFKLLPGHKAAWLVFVTPTGQAVRFRLP